MALSLRSFPRIPAELAKAERRRKSAPTHSPVSLNASQDLEPLIQAVSFTFFGRGKKGPTVGRFLGLSKPSLFTGKTTPPNLGILSQKAEPKKNPLSLV